MAFTEVSGIGKWQSREASLGRRASHRMRIQDANGSAVDHDSTEFDAIYKSHRLRVYRICLRMVRNPVEAEDLTQETFARVFCKLDTFRGQAAFTTWLHRLTTNVVLMSFRRKSPGEASLDDASISEMIDRRVQPVRPDAAQTRLVERINLRAAVNQLPDGCKEAFLLHEVEGYRHTEIARMLGCSVANSKSQSFRARQRLKELLSSSQKKGGWQFGAK